MLSLCERYLAEHGRHKKTAAGDAWMIKKYILPEFEDLRAADVRFAHIANLHRRLKAKPYLANRLLSLLSKMFHLAELWEMRPSGSNPCQHVTRYAEKKRKRYLSALEARAVMTAVEARFDKHPLECGLLLLELLTGARPSELKTATWSMIQGDRLEHDDTKTGQRTIYLSPQALAVLARIPRCREWIIGPDVNARYVWASVLGDTKLLNLHMYDLRHAFASFGLAAGFSLPQIGGLLGHSSPATTARYAHLMDGAAAATKIGDML